LTYHEGQINEPTLPPHAAKQFYRYLSQTMTTTFVSEQKVIAELSLSGT